MRFSDRAVFWMREFRDHPAGDPAVKPPVMPGVGSDWVRQQRLSAANLAKLKTSYHITDCITFVGDVIQRAYRDLGDQMSAKGVQASGNSGTKLAEYLIGHLRWRAYYWNPDPDLSEDEKLFEEQPEAYIGRHLYTGDHPYSGLSDPVYMESYRENFLKLSESEKARKYDQVLKYVGEHSFSASVVKSSKLYYRIKVVDSITGYRPTARGSPSQNYLGRPFPKEPLAPSQQTAKSSLEKLEKFNSQVKFGFGIARGGTHTFLFADGDVYEVHWSSGPADDPSQSPLYQVTPLIDWGWESGAIVVPPDISVKLQ